MFSHRQMLRVRKSAWLVLVLALVFIISKVILPSLVPRGTPPIVGPSPRAADSVGMVFSRSMVDGVPFGEDSVFQSGRDRVHAYSRSPGVNNLSHHWFWGGSLRYTAPCPAVAICVSSLPPDSLSVGDWSVDLVSGTNLVASRQFRILE
jgi:hypothetical protein